MENIVQLISSLGFPIVSAIAMFVGCRYLLDNQQKQTDRMFELYEKANDANRDAIRANTEAINRLCDKLDKQE